MSSLIVVSGCEFKPVANHLMDDSKLSLLLQDVTDGDKAALKGVYDLTANRLFKLLLRIVGRREIAEDLLQDVFITVWQKAGQFDASRGSASGWLLSLTRRKAIDFLRSVKRENLCDDTDVAGEDRGSDWNRMNIDMRLHIHMRKLRPDYSRALMLCFQLGLTHEELAEHLDVPLGTAKSFVKRGIAELKKNFLEDGFAY